MTFQTLGLDETLVRALSDAGFTEPTAVQAEAIPAAMAGADLTVASRTGSGKTAAYLLPALVRVLAARATEPVLPVADREPRPRGPKQRHGGPFAHGPRSGFGTHAPRGPALPALGPLAVVLAPTRELALQVAEAAHALGRHVPRLRVATIVGGVPYGAQLRALGGPLDILIATPGRLLDHLGAGRLPLSRVGLFVLDEADRMLDMGFIDDIRAVADALPPSRQTLMFSATFAGAAGALAARMLRQPRHIEVAGHTATHADIEQRLHWADDRGHKAALLEHILAAREVDQALVFTSTQRDAEELALRLADMGHAVDALHGGMPQGRRNRVLDQLRTRRLRVLVATDVAARGIDVPTISHVINYGLPMKEEDYVHRIGRTGRAGRTGLAVTLAERRDAGMVHRIQRFTTQRIPASTIAGLEPRMAEPMLRPKPAGGTGSRPGFKPGGGKRFGGGGGKPGYGKPFARGPRPAR